MNSQGIYGAWKARRGCIEVREDFRQAVMNRIYQYGRGKRKPWFNAYRLIELISAHRLAKFGLVAMAAVGGVLRAVLVVYGLLGA